MQEALPPVEEKRAAPPAQRGTRSHAVAAGQPPSPAAAIGALTKEAELDTGAQEAIRAMQREHAEQTKKLEVRAGGEAAKQGLTSAVQIACLPRLSLFAACLGAE
jgi:hypothetical protein